MNTEDRVLKLIFGSLLVAAASLGCGRAGEHPGGTPAVIHLNRGLAAAHQGDEQAAITEFRLALEADADNIAAYYNLGVAYSHLRDFEREEAAYHRVIELAPRADVQQRQHILPATHYNLAILHLKRGDKAAAFADLEQTLASTSDPDAYYHDLLRDNDLVMVREDPRFVQLMRRYWPDYGKVIGVLPVDRPADASAPKPPVPR